MARLSNFKIDSKAVQAGAWVSPGDEYDDLQILTRGFTDAYTDARSAKMRRAAVQFNGDQAKIPNATSRAITVDCLESHVLLDVRNLADDAGAPVLFPAFCDLLRNPDYADLLTACIKAAGQVGVRKVVDLEDALPNSPPPSA
jgi:CTP:molybdopterin cytidylyltransferase MocA